MKEDSLKELQAKAKELNIKNYRKYNKAELRDVIQKHGELDAVAEPLKNVENNHIQDHLNEAIKPDHVLVVVHIDTLDFKRLPEEAKDTLTNGFKLIYGGDVYLLRLHENYMNQQLFRMFSTTDFSKMLLFTLVPKGRFGNVPVCDVWVHPVKLVDKDTWTYEHGFVYDPKNNTMTKRIGDATFVHQHQLEDSFAFRENTNLLGGKPNRFASDPTESSYITFQNEFFFCNTAGFIDGKRTFLSYATSKAIVLKSNANGTLTADVLHL